MMLLVAPTGEAHWAFEFISHQTESLLFGATKVNAVSKAMALPLTTHLNDGAEPPLITWAVNKIESPAQMLFCDALMVTEGVTPGLTVMVTLLLITVSGFAQAALLIS